MAVKHELERRYWGIFTIGLYSLWLREDGVPREVTSMTSSGGRRGKWRETVQTAKPAPIDEYGPGGDSDRASIPFVDFLATHTPIPREEWDRHRPPKQLDLIDEAHALERQLRRRRRLTPELEFELRWIGPAFHGNPPWGAAAAERR